MAITIGTAPDSWGVWFASDSRQLPWQRFLDEAAQAGYEWIELGPYGYLPTDPAALHRELERRNLRVASGVVMANLEEPAGWGEVERQLLGVGAQLAALDARYLVLIDGTYTDLFTGRAIEPPRLAGDAWQRLIEATHRVARLAREQFGLTTVFHPHAETHIEYEDQIAAFLAGTDPDLVSLCLDTGHHAYRGGDPVAFTRAHHRRIAYLHLKSVDPTLAARVAREKLPFATAVGAGMFSEPDAGAVDFLAFRDALRDVGYDGWAIVEQDMYPVEFDRPLPIARRTREYLRQIGLG